MTVGGWFDAENLFGALETYKNVEAISPGANNVLVMGPWSHGGWSRVGRRKLGPVAVRFKYGEYFREHIEFPFFQYYLKGKGTPIFPEAWVFETGTNQWKKYDAWPPRAIRQRSLFLQPGGGLAFEQPPQAARETLRRIRERPGPPRGVHRANRDRMTGDYMVQDQRVASRRPDVLVYESEPCSRTT